MACQVIPSVIEVNHVQINCQTYNSFILHLHACAITKNITKLRRAVVAGSHGKNTAEKRRKPDKSI